MNTNMEPIEDMYKDKTSNVQAETSTCEYTSICTDSGLSYSYKDLSMNKDTNNSTDNDENFDINPNLEANTASLETESSVQLSSVSSPKDDDTDKSWITILETLTNKELAKQLNACLEQNKDQIAEIELKLKNTYSYSEDNLSDDLKKYLDRNINKDKKVMNKYTDDNADTSSNTNLHMETELPVETNEIVYSQQLDACIKEKTGKVAEIEKKQNKYTNSEDELSDDLKKYLDRNLQINEKDSDEYTDDDADTNENTDLDMESESSTGINKIVYSQQLDSRMKEKTEKIAKNEKIKNTYTNSEDELDDDLKKYLDRNIQKDKKDTDEHNDIEPDSSEETNNIEMSHTPTGLGAYKHLFLDRSSSTDTEIDMITSGPNMDEDINTHARTSMRNARLSSRFCIDSDSSSELSPEESLWIDLRTVINMWLRIKLMRHLHILLNIMVKLLLTLRLLLHQL